MSSLEYCKDCDSVHDLDILCADAAKVSDPEDKMDELVSSSSIPNLASLFKAGKKAGLIKPAAEYGN